MQKWEHSRKLGKKHQAKVVAGWAEVGPSQPTQPATRPSRPPFDLAASQAIYSPLTESHARIHLSSTAEEQRSLRDTPSRRGGSLLTVKIRQPSHEFTFGVGISFIHYPFVLTPVV
jgi:hypothetical protein